MSKAPAISVVIVWQHERDDLAACLRTICPQVEAAGGEVIVVGSVSRKAVANARARASCACWLLLDGPRDQAGAWSAGLAAARGTIIAFGSARNRYERQWVETILTAAPAHDEIVAGPVTPTGRASSSALGVFLCDYGAFVDPQGGGGGGGAACNVAFHARSLRQAARRQGLDKTALLTRGGFRVRWVPQAAVGVSLDAPVRAQIAARYSRGRHYAAVRSEGWPLFARVAAGLVCVALPPILLARLMGNRFLIRRYGRALIRGLPATCQALVWWSLGEMAGYWFGERRANSDGWRNATPASRRSAHAGSPVPAGVVERPAMMT